MECFLEIVVNFRKFPAAAEKSAAHRAAL